MYFRRFWNIWAPRELRSISPLTFVLTTAILVTLTYLVFYSLGLALLYGRPEVCFSEVNLERARLLNVSARVHVIPSTPRGGRQGKNSKLEGDGGDEEPVSTKPCIPVPAPPFRGSKDSLVICIHNPDEDQVISAHLKKKAAWEPENIRALSSAFAQNPSLMLVDLGCNVGVYTLPAAHLGMEVLALDAMESSLRLLQRSLLFNGLSCQVTLVHNALYRKRMRMRIARDPINVGASRVVEIMASRRHKVKEKDQIDAICLDDLVPLVKGRDVFLKMDLEESEDAVLECAHKFFAEVNVKILLLEWLYFRHQEARARAIMDFLLQHGMKPTWNAEQDRQIDIYAAHNWPDNVFWVKTS